MDKALGSPAPKLKFVEAFIIVCMLLHKVLDIYAVSGSLTFGNIADLAIFGLCFTVKKQNNKTPTFLWLYIIYRFLVSALTFNSWQSLIPIGFILQVSALYALFRVVYLQNLIRIYRVLVIITSVFLLIQYIAQMVFNIRISGILEFLPIAIGGDEYLNLFYARDTLRPSSIFSEPAHFAQFVLPYLCIELFDKSRKTSYLIVILGVVTLFLSMSGTAVTGLLVLGVFYVYTLMSQHVSFRKIWWLILLLIMLPVGFNYYSHSLIGETILNRSELVLEAQNASSISSEYVRLFRGYDVYGELPTFNKIFGCGDKENIIKYINSSKYSSLFDSENFYFNGISTILLYTGLIGLLIYIGVFVSLWKGNSICGKACVILLASLMMIASILLSATGAVMLFMASSYQKARLSNRVFLKEITT